MLVSGHRWDSTRMCWPHSAIPCLCLAKFFFLGPLLLKLSPEGIHTTHPNLTPWANPNFF